MTIKQSFLEFLDNIETFTENKEEISFYIEYVECFNTDTYLIEFDGYECFKDYVLEVSEEYNDNLVKFYEDKTFIKILDFNIGDLE